MNEIHPVTELMNDHRLIEKVMAELERRLALDPAAVPAAFVAQALAFFTGFADASHHFKEEEALFPALAARGVPVEGGPIGMMLHEHGVGRKLLAGMRAELEAAGAGDGKACAALRDYAARYIELLRNHIWKEDNVLFRMAQQLLDEEAAAALRARFRESAQATAEATQGHADFAAAL